jgi:hypothetical protein
MLQLSAGIPDWRVGLGTALELISERTGIDVYPR